MPAVRDVGQGIREGHVLHLVLLLVEELRQPADPERDRHVRGHHPDQEIGEGVPRPSRGHFGERQRGHAGRERGRRPAPAAVIGEQEGWDERKQPEEGAVLGQPIGKQQSPGHRNCQGGQLEKQGADGDTPTMATERDRHRECNFGILTGRGKRNRFLSNFARGIPTVDRSESWGVSRGATREAGARGCMPKQMAPTAVTRGRPPFAGPAGGWYASDVADLPRLPVRPPSRPRFRGA